MEALPVFHEGSQQQPLWEMAADGPAYSSLHGSVCADVCVIGAGIAGLSTAYELQRAGASVVVLESEHVGAGMSGLTSGHLSSALDDRYATLERCLGTELTRIAAESHMAAIDHVATLTVDEHIDCEFERLNGYLFNPPGGNANLLEGEYTAALRAGATVDRVPRAPLADFHTGPALRFSRQAQFHPLKYLRGLAAAFGRRGGRLFTGSHATVVTGGPAAYALTGEGRVSAGNVVIATNGTLPSHAALQSGLTACTTSLIGLRAEEGSLPHALFWDTRTEGREKSNTYHYARTWRCPGGDVLLVGGEDCLHGHGSNPGACFRDLETWARQRFPEAGPVAWRWTGRIMEPVDGMGFIGPNPLDEGNVYIITGDSGNGLTHGVIAGMLLRSLLQGRPHPWAGLYDPRRVPLQASAGSGSLKVPARQNGGGSSPPGDVLSADSIPPGCGAILHEGTRKIAVYRDKQGRLHHFSAVCPLQHCLVRWNTRDHTWDCPCHGSRFDEMGRAIDGPAGSDLAVV